MYDPGKARGHDLFKRSGRNPILTADQWPYMVNSVFNAGAVRLHSGETLLLARAEDMRGISHLCAARSENGMTDWEIDSEPTLLPDPENYPEETWGIEDPRITWLEEKDRYAVSYACYSLGGPGVALAFTEHFRDFSRLGMVLSPDDKDAALFPRKFDDRWAMIHRPMSLDHPAHIWLSWSPDLKHWGEARILIEARRGAWLGRAQDRPLHASPGDGPGLADLLPRHPQHGVRRHLPPGSGAAGPGRPPPGAAAERRVDLRTRTRLRENGRRARRGLPLRTDARRRLRYPSPLLWRGGHPHLRGHGQPGGGAGMAGAERPPRRGGQDPLTPLGPQGQRPISEAAGYSIRTARSLSRAT